MTGTFRIGTRGSALATTQTGTVARALEDASGVAAETVLVRTEGDVVSGPLAQMGGTGVFAAALRMSLLEGACDVAVHSLKDLPTAQPDGLVVAATPAREDVRDALCARDGLTLAGLPEGASVGTGSPRRAAQLLAARPDLRIVDIRGNVGTRLSRVRGLDPLEDHGVGRETFGDLDAVVLAAAGLRRLGFEGYATELLGPDTMLPAPGQGALAVEVRTAGTGHDAVDAALAAMDDPATRLAVTAERSLLGRLEAGCAAPIGALGTVDGGTLRLEAVACAPDGSAVLRRGRAAALDTASTGAPSLMAAAALGVALAEELLADGAAELTGLA